MAGKSNAKGGDFERLVCRQLTEWIAGVPKPELFWRSATSGAKATQDAKAGHKSKMGGDIVAIDAQGQWFTDAFSVECKNRKDYGNLDLLFVTKGDFLAWWRQTVGDADRANKIPLMICKRWHGKTLVVYPSKYHNINAPTTAFTFWGVTTGTITICQFDQWLAANDPTLMQSTFGPKIHTYTGHRAKHAPRKI